MRLHEHFIKDFNYKKKNSEIYLKRKPAEQSGYPENTAKMK
jgi:hypothetical protein